MNYVQIPEETAKILHKLAVSAAAKVVNQDEAERAIVACGVLTQALSHAKPLPKKPGPKPDANINLPPDKNPISWRRVEVEQAEKLMEGMPWKPEQLPRYEAGDTFTDLNGVRCEVITAEDNPRGGQIITYKELDE